MKLFQRVKAGDQINYGIGKTQDNQPTRWFIYAPLFVIPWKKWHFGGDNCNQYYGYVTLAVRINFRRKYVNVFAVEVEFFQRDFGKQVKLAKAHQRG